MEHLTPTERKEYLEGVLSKIGVGLDNKSNEHLVSLEFRFPIVGDDYLNRQVREGDNISVIKGSFSSPYHNRNKTSAKKKAKNTEKKG